MSSERDNDFQKEVVLWRQLFRLQSDFDSESKTFHTCSASLSRTIDIVKHKAMRIMEENKIKYPGIQEPII